MQRSYVSKLLRRILIALRKKEFENKNELLSGRYNNNKIIL